MVRKMNPSEKVYARGDRSEFGLVWMDQEVKFGLQKLCHDGKRLLKLLAIRRKKNEVVSVANVLFGSKSVLHELVELIHVDVGEKLRGEVPEWKTFTRFNVEAVNDSLQKPHHILVTQSSSEYRQEDLMVDARKKLSDITLEYPDSSSMIMRYFPSHGSESVESLMSPFFLAARKRIGNEGRIKNGIEFAVYCAVEHTVCHVRLMDPSSLGVTNGERLICSMFVTQVPESYMEVKKIFHEPTLEFLHVLSGTLPFHEFTPCLK